MTGTPADCVHIALKGLLDYRPDLVVSGINNGANMGDDTIYSGTVGAAMEAYLFGIPAIAFSQIEKGWAHVDAAARAARRLVEQIERERMLEGGAFLLNVNVPNLPFDELKSIKVCRLGRRHAAEKVITQDSPRGETMYWIARRRQRQGQRRGHRLPCDGGWPYRAHAAADRSDRPCQSEPVARDGGSPGRAVLTWRSQRPGFPCPAHAHRVAPRRAGARPPCPPSRSCITRLRWPPTRVRARMVQRLAAQGIADARVLRAMGAVERHRFVDSALVNQAYEDTSLPIGLGQTISKPNVVARMIELLLGAPALANKPADRLGRVLEIGTGCGYQAAVLSHVATEVYSIERLRGLHERARTNLRSFRLATVHLLLGDGMVGFAKGAPYAGIIAAAGGEAVPEAWIAQLAVGGRIVAPTQSEVGKQALVVIDKTARGLERRILEAVHFVPLKSGIA